MALSAAEQRRIIEQESAWIDDGSFGRLDLSAFPALQPPPPPEQHDDRFAKDWRDTGLSRDASALRQFVSDPDADALERAGRETGDPNFREEVRDRKGELIAQQFKRACPDYIPTQHNFDLMTGTLAFNALSAAQQDCDTEDQVAALIDGEFWTVPNLIACYNALTREGLLDVPAGTARNLSERERLRVARLAQAGRADDAIGEYLRCALDGEEPTIEMVQDPAYRTVCNDAVLTVFEEITLDYVPTPERQRYLLRHCGNRPLTLALLQQAWRACQANEQRHERGELLEQYQRPQDQPNERELNDLSDAAVENLYRASLREYVKSIKGPGALV